MIKTVWDVTFYVSNLEKASEFYENKLDLKKSARVGPMPKISERQQVDPTSTFFGILVDNAEKLYKELEDQGSRFIMELHEESLRGKQANPKDLDANVLNITQTHRERHSAVPAEGAKKT